jgi:hypothetical protein
MAIESYINNTRTNLMREIVIVLGAVASPNKKKIKIMSLPFWFSPKIDLGLVG